MNGGPIPAVLVAMLADERDKPCTMLAEFHAKLLGALERWIRSGGEVSIRLSGFGGARVDLYRADWPGGDRVIVVTRPRLTDALANALQAVAS